MLSCHLALACIELVSELPSLPAGYPEPAIEEEQKQPQYPPTSAALSISCPDKRCPWGGVSRYQPAVY
jgi:hypothetical protein